MRKEREFHLDINLFKKILFESLSVETCYPKDRKDWKPENPAWGHCAVTALLVQEFFGGEILDNNETLKHFWNKIDNKEIDLTESQFEGGKNPYKGQGRNRDRKNLLRGHTKQRYFLLRKRFSKQLKRSES